MMITSNLGIFVPWMEYVLELYLLHHSFENLVNALKS